MADLSMTWTVHAGFATVRVGDSDGSAEALASYVSPAPEDFLGAVARLLRGSATAEVRFEAKPAVYRWHFTRDGSHVRVRLAEFPDGRRPGTEVWSTRQPLDVVARVVVRRFDAAARRGEDTYEREWRRPFPRFELEGLRAAWREVTR
ncbi:hypothetical protein [Lentzea sp.]|uniref:hypothetical protein n=1 Tax=Lentzea sp. TaxID=56099 RepID=UPI002ED668B5